MTGNDRDNIRHYSGVDSPVLESSVSGDAFDSTLNELLIEEMQSQIARSMEIISIALESPLGHLQAEYLTIVNLTLHDTQKILNSPALSSANNH